MVVDDHAVVREGLERLLSAASDIEVVGTAPDGNAALGVFKEARPDVVLMDLSMPVMDGIEATKRLQEESPPPRIVILTSFSDRNRIFEALDAGAIGYLLKDAE